MVVHDNAPGASWRKMIIFLYKLELPARGYLLDRIIEKVGPYGHKHYSAYKVDNVHGNWMYLHVSVYIILFSLYQNTDYYHFVHVRHNVIHFDV